MRWILFLLLATTLKAVAGVPPPADTLPVRGLCIGAPSPAQVSAFTDFISKELPARGVNTLVLRVDYGYRYRSHPEVGDPEGLSADDARRIAGACRQAGVRLIPEIDLLGHQSWAGTTGRLLQAHPEFDETPWVKMPAHYTWPNEDNLYCKSYCPLHPLLHAVVFDLMDELCDAFGADAFHAGMDEVFYIAEPRCPRCGGRDPAELFAGEVRALHDHLAGRGRSLWIWGDRLIDGKTTGMGIWEASGNNTFRAVDMIPKDVTICDWHYERADPSAVYFAMKGFPVVSCPYRNPATAVQQKQDMLSFRSQSTPAMAARFRGVMQTVWSSWEQFREAYARQRPSEKPSAADAFKVLFPRQR